MRLVFHLTTQALWEAAGENYLPPNYAEEGFIHLSYAEQWRLSWMRYYQGQSGLLLLGIDPALVRSPLRIENGFPHLYGPLPRQAVLWSRPLPPLRDLRVALLSSLRPTRAELEELAAEGADLVMLPELPFQDWHPANPAGSARPHGPWELLRPQAELARQAGVALLGGGWAGRHNLACLWDQQGHLRLQYAKMHLPQEPGFWEADYFDPGGEGPRVCDDLGFPLGVQICSDIQRPFGAGYLMAQGCGAILAPRATEVGTFEHWKRVYRATARMHCCYVLSVNRPAAEHSVPLGGPSLVVGPEGEVLAEEVGRVTWATLSPQRIVEARGGYPGYLSQPLATYARAWSHMPPW